MSDYDSSGQDALSSDSEESFEEENDLGSKLQDLSGNSYRQSGGNQQRSSINGAKKLVPDLEDPGTAPLHKDREKRQMQLYGAHLKGKLTNRSVNQKFCTRKVRSELCQSSLEIVSNRDQNRLKPRVQRK